MINTRYTINDLKGRQKCETDNIVLLWSHLQADMLVCHPDHKVCIYWSKFYIQYFVPTEPGWDQELQADHSCHRRQQLHLTARCPEMRNNAGTPSRYFSTSLCHGVGHVELVTELRILFEKPFVESLTKRLARIQFEDLNLQLTTNTVTIRNDYSKS